MKGHSGFALLRITIVFCFFFAKNLSAQDNIIKFSNLDIQDGLSQSSVNSILQDQLGFIWLATQDGLNKFDGYSFTVYRSIAGDSLSLPHNFITALLQDSSGKLWVGTERGFAEFDRRNNQFRRHPLSIGGNQVAVSALVSGNKNQIWIGTQAHGLYLFNQDSSTFTQIEPFRGMGIQSLLYHEGKLWIGTLGNGLLGYNPARNDYVIFSRDSKSTYISNDLVWDVVADESGNLWVGTNGGLNHINLNTLKTTTYRHSSYVQGSISSDIVRSINVDRSGSVWIGTSDGLNRFDQQTDRFHHFVHSPFIQGSLIDNNVYSIFEDRSGILWIGTNRGISKFDNSKQHFIHFRNIPYDKSSLSSDMVWSIYRDQRHQLWIGHSEGLDLFSAERKKIKTFVLPIGADFERSVFSMVPGSFERIWLGTDDGIYILNGANSTPEKWHQQGGSPVRGRVYTLFKDSQERIWVGTRDGLYLIPPDHRNARFFSGGPGSLNNSTVRCLLEMPNGDILAGTGGGGINRIRVKNDSLSFSVLWPTSNMGMDGDNNIILDMHYEKSKGLILAGTYGGGLLLIDTSGTSYRRISEQDGLTNNVVYSAYTDRMGRIWMSTNKGISAYQPDSATFFSFFRNDGLQSNEFNTGAHFQAPDGELFFGGIDGFNAFYPEKIRGNPIPPQMVITSLQIFNRSIQPGENSPLSEDISSTEEVILSYRDDVITLEFAALHYGSPEQNQYAYKLEGFDENWNTVRGRRQVTYTNLDPGEYTFQVRGSNSDGIWNSEPASLRIIIKPPFWQTWWFRLIGIASLLLIALTIYKSRMAIIQAQKRHLLELVGERTAKIQEQKKKIENQNSLLESEKEKVEKLLLNIFPSETVEELKNKGKASARHYRMSTVMFTDFKGFTKIAELIRPKDLVAELDKYFIKFDEIVDKFGLEKIKTIGDAYMVAGGIPIRNKSNPIDMVLAALEIQQYVTQVARQKKENGEPVWELRIGIHTGELIAGVVGTKRFAYDVWGDTVNVASRMESNGAVGKVNISGVTYGYVKEFFECSYRGKVNAKNKGDIDMYYVERIRPELSENGEGLIANEKFKSTVATALFYKINYKKAEQFILKKLEEELPKDLFYHGLHHTISVRDAAERIGKAEGIEGEELMVLKTAAMYHDAGFVEQYFKNEPIGVRMAREILPDFGYSPRQIDQVTELILATQVPQKAYNLMEMIICDADLDYLGREDFHPVSDTLKMELMARGKVKNSREWDAVQISFLESHHYFTEYSKAKREPVKQKHLEEIKQRYALDRYED